MATGYFREHVDNEVPIEWPMPQQRMTILQFFVKTLLFLLVVWLLAIFVGSPNDRPYSTPALFPVSKSAQPEQVKTIRPIAISVIRPIGDNVVRGTLHFVKSADEIEIRGVIEGLALGEHGFHIHEFGDLSDDKAGMSAGGHFNPTNQPHGRQDANQRHIGGLGNIKAGTDGKAIVHIRDSAIQFEGPNSVVGRSIVIHADADKFTQPAGDAGARVAFGVIGIADGE